MGNKKMGIAMLGNLVGALFAYLIGSGFATGQETMQFFSSWGSVWACVVVGLITSVMMYLSYVSYAYAGRTRGIEDLAGVFEFYAGRVVGRIFEAFAWVFNACCYIFMISGFANVLHQQWGIQIEIGSAIAVAVSVGTAVLGLNKMVEVIGKIGPVVVLFTLLLGIISAFKFYPHIAEGNAAINSGLIEVKRAGSNVFTAGLSFGGCCLLLVSAFVARMGNDLRQYKFRYTRLILALGALGIPFCSVVLGLNHIGNIKEAASSAIPNLLLANSFYDGTGSLFALVILAAVYSTLCPIIWTCVSMFIKDEKSIAYKAACIIAGVVVYFVTLFIPYQTLLNYIMTYCGYTGSLVFLVCVVRYFVIKSKDEKERPLAEGSVPARDLI